MIKKAEAIFSIGQKTNRFNVYWNFSKPFYTPKFSDAQSYHNFSLSSQGQVDTEVKKLNKTHEQATQIKSLHFEFDQNFERIH